MIDKKMYAIIGVVLAAFVGCSSSSATRDDSSAASATSASLTPRSVAVTLPSGADEPVKATATTTTTTTGVVVQEPTVIPSDLLFTFDSATLSDEAGPLLAAVLSRIKGTIVSIRVDGHTDAAGSEAYNQDLSIRRAEAVRDWFEDHDVPKDLIHVAGWGEAESVAPNDTPENKAKNRRVEIMITASR